MPRFRFILALVALATLAGSLLPAAMGASAMAREGRDKVDPLLWNQLEARDTVEFYVILAAQADLAGAARRSTKADKTAYVYEQLVRTARETQGPLLDYLRDQGAPFQSMYIQNMIRVQAGRAVLEWLARRAEVARIVRPPEAAPDPVEGGGRAGKLAAGPEPAGIEWNIARVQAPAVWAMGFRGEGIVVGSLDTGVQYDHPALTAQYRGNLGGGNFDNNYNWWDCSGNPQFPQDQNGHGTHTTGTMVGDDGAGNQIGVAPGARWMACNGLDSCSPPMCFEFFLAPTDLSGQNPRPDLAPDVINNSWHDVSGFDYRQIIRNLIAAGIGVVKSAGNDGPECHTINDPGYVPEVLTTGNFGPGDIIANSSSRGPSDEYGEVIVKPEVAAPGSHVRSSIPPDGYETKTGTSMAAPHSTALVALMWDAAPCLQGNFTVTKEIILATALPVVDGQCPPFVEIPNDVWGWGAIDDYRAVLAALDYCGETGRLTGHVTALPGGEPLPGATVAAKRLAGGQWRATTDGTGAYGLNLLPGTYTVTAGAYGYHSAVVTGTAIVTGEATLQDFALLPAPQYTLSGACVVSGTGAPLSATVQVLGSPLAPVSTNPATGQYSLTVATGAYTLQVTADGYHRQQRAVVMDHAQRQDFALTALPCILLVDDDENSPNTRAYYTSALAALDVPYDVWDLAGSGNPSGADLDGYRAVIWYTGQPYNDTLNRYNEQILAAYLDSGGSLLLSSQDYLWDNGLDAFGRDFLGILTFTNDVVEVAMVGNLGNPIGDGLGPYTLEPPLGWGSYFWTDVVSGYDSPFRWFFIGQNNSTNYAGGNFKTVFMAWPLEGLAGLGDRVTVLGRALDWFGGCSSCTPPAGVDFAWEPITPTVGQPLTLTAWATGTAPISFTWELGDGTIAAGDRITHAYLLTGAFHVTLTATGECTATRVAHEIVVEPVPCVPAGEVVLSWAPLTPTVGQVVTLTAGAEGEEPITYTWALGDGARAAGAVITHTYAAAATYRITVTAGNACGEAIAWSDIVVDALPPEVWRIFLPVLDRSQGF